MDTTLDAAFQQAAERDHVALIYRTQREQFTAVVPFLRTGLERGEQFVYIANENRPDTVLDALRTDGLDVDALRKSGALHVVTDRDAYLRTGRFEPEGMIEFIENASKRAIEAGYTGLRATGEMSWALSDAPGVESLMVYERKLDQRYRDMAFTALCQYNANRFPADTVDQVSRAHPRLIVDGVLRESAGYVPSPTGLDWPTEAFAALLTPYIDGELPESTTAEVARRIEADAELRRRYESELAVKRTLGAQARRYTTPPGLVREIKEAIFGPHDAER